MVMFPFQEVFSVWQIDFINFPFGLNQTTKSKNDGLILLILFFFLNTESKLTEFRQAN